MLNPTKLSQRNGWIAAGIVFGLIVGIILLIALINAPTMGGPRVMATAESYLNEVVQTGIPFMIIVGIGAVVLGIFAAVEVRRVWHNRNKRNDLFTACP